MLLRLTVVTVATLLLVSNGRCQNEFGHLQNALKCYRRYYSYTATQTDEQGRQCRGTVRALSCWGGCDSAEIPYWKFPYKQSYHRVCLPIQLTRKLFVMSDCDPDVEPSLKFYHFYEPRSCVCQTCGGISVNCEVYRTGHLNHKRNSRT